MNSLDSALQTLRAGDFPPAPLFPEGGHDLHLPGGLLLNADPGARISGRWSSPPGRLVEIETGVAVPGRWLGLHLPLPPVDLDGALWIVLALRTSAAAAAAIRPCLRSGLPAEAGGGFRDDFFPRAALAQPRESDHLDRIAPDHLPDLPRAAPWRELVLFLPPAIPLHLALHELRLALL